MTVLQLPPLTDHKTVCKHAMFSLKQNIISRLRLLIAGADITVQAVKIKKGKSPAQRGITYTRDDLLVSVG